MKKLLSVLLCLCLMFCSCITANANSVVEESDPAILSESAVSELKEDYDLTSEAGKKEYLREVFNNIGVDEKYVNLLKGDLLDDFVNSEKYGCTITEPKQNQGISLLSNGSNEKYIDDVYLVIVWSKNDDEYALMGACEWDGAPFMKLKDIISLDLGAGSVVNGSQVLVLQYEKDAEFHELSYNENSVEYIGRDTDCIFKFDVPSGIDSLVIAVGYNIKNSSDYNTISLQYFHQYLPGNVDVSVSFYLGISLSTNWGMREYPLQCGTA